MINNKNFMWLHREVREIDEEIKYHKEKGIERDPKLVYKLMFVLGLIALFGLTPPLDARVVKKQISYEWVCSCGYDNYDGIRYCPLCGSER